jgi:hypothetical protein
MLLGVKPLTITKRQAKELLSPKLVDRLIYAAKNFPEMGWLEILPKEEGKEVRETYIVYESLDETSDENRGRMKRFSARSGMGKRVVPQLR